MHLTFNRNFNIIDMKQICCGAQLLDENLVSTGICRTVVGVCVRTLVGLNSTTSSTNLNFNKFKSFLTTVLSINNLDAGDLSFLSHSELNPWVSLSSRMPVSSLGWGRWSESQLGSPFVLVIGIHTWALGVFRKSTFYELNVLHSFFMMFRQK